jgi:glycosyltransferase involved in cell wall biosynthesis
VPAHNEAESIEYVVRDFRKRCRQVIVLDNQSPDGTARKARDAGAVVYSESLAGYGDAIKKGLDRSDADILVVVEADGTFRANDLPKLLTYLLDSDAVIGSRTYWHYVEYGANMGFLQREVNLIFGLLVTLLWWNRQSRFTDVGCSYRAFWRESYERVADRLIGKGPEFAPELVIEFLNDWQRVIEVPVPYHARVLGTSKFSGGFWGSAKTALRMLRMILCKRWSGWLRSLHTLITSDGEAPPKVEEIPSQRPANTPVTIPFPRATAERPQPSEQTPARRKAA